jgi:hypothetical protein
MPGGLVLISRSKFADHTSSSRGRTENRSNDSCRVSECLGDDGGVGGRPSVKWDDRCISVMGIWRAEKRDIFCLVKLYR